MDLSDARRYVQVGFGMPERQNRWTVAFRLVLAIPHIVVFLALFLVAYLLIVIGWFAAIFMGRLPRWTAEFLAGFLLYATRFYAYLWLMTDTYPPFGWGHGETYPVNVDVPYTRVRRLAVLFRAILLIPAQLVVGVVSNGFQLVLVFIWLVVLVAGRMPLALFGAEAAILRFQARYYAYAIMLTGKYPGELFGDGPQSASQPMAPPGVAQAPPFGSAPATGGAPLPPPVPPYPSSPTTVPSPPAVPPAGAFAPDVPPPGAPPGATPVVPPASSTFPTPPAGPPRTARLVLSTRSKRLLVLFIVLGVLEYVGIAVAVATTSGNRAAFDALVQAHDSLGNQINTAQTQLQACGSGTLQCNETYQGQLADAFSTFGEDVSTIHFPSAAQGDVQKLESDTAQLSSLLHQMASAPDVASYQSEFSQAQTLGNQFDADYSSLAASLLF